MDHLLHELLSTPLVRYALYVLGPVFVVGIFLLSRPAQLLTIARNTFIESVRQPIYFILIVLSGIFQVFNVWGSGFSMGYTESGELSGDNQMLLGVGVATIFVCGTLLAAFISTAVISREIDNKTVLTVVSKPVPRVSVVLGKFLGVAGAVTVAGVTMVLFLLLGVRHGVMSTAADNPDMPVIVFAVIAVASAVGIGAWCNFFYGWSFTQTCTMLLCPFSLAAFLAVLVVGKEWRFQAPLTDLKPQVTIACTCVILSLVVLSAVATAASARLGQVMTIVLCSGVFVFGLLSNYFIGSRAFGNTLITRLASANPVRSNEASLANTGDTYNVTFVYEPSIKIEPGMPFFYGPNPNGFPLANLSFVSPDRAKVDFSSPDAVDAKGLAPALVFTSVDHRTATIKHVGPDAHLVRTPPTVDDYVFITPTRINLLGLAAWGIVPNVQFFWLVDAVTQNQPIPASHIGLIILYSIAQTGIFLSLAVVLFQTREVG